ncbi:MAG: flippase-like domain-containing protein, partial [Planctomycetes bacterium]|nr:flippase-like domain-containing protein [Planctomycetota bacterium]
MTSRPCLRWLRWVAAVGAVAALAATISWGDLAEMVARLSVGGAALALVPAAGMLWLTSRVHGRLLAGLGLALPTREWLALGVAGAAVNLLTPVRGAAVLRAAYLARRHRLPVADYLALLGASGGAEVGAMALWGLAAAAAAADGPLAALHGTALAVVLGAALAAGRLRAPGALGRVLAAGRTLLGRPALGGETVLLLAMNFLLEVSLFVLAFRAMGVEVDPAALVLMVATANLAALLPWSATDLGVREAMVGLAGGLTGTGAEASVVAAVVMRASLSAVALVALPWTWRVLAPRRPPAGGS